MTQVTSEQPDYGNWVSKRIIATFTIITLILAAASWFWTLLLIPALATFIVACYFAYGRYLFSPSGGDIQTKVRTLLLDQIQWDGNGRILDIGCGGGALTIALAQKYPHATVVGIDSWGARWEFSQQLCEKNARIAGVQDRVSFGKMQKASASTLPFPDESFDLAVSNLVFHEVRDTKDKRRLLKEALRTVKTDGVFAFQDLFLSKRVYGDVYNLVETLRSWGMKQVEFIPTRESPVIPRTMKPWFILGTIGIIKGKK